MKLLRIDSSARKNSVSRQLTQKFVETWRKQNPTGEVIDRDLATTHLPHITDEWMLAAHSDLAKLTPAQRETLSISDALVDELLAADTIVIGAPMYNLTISAPLKAWIDQIVRVGRTVLWGPTGTEGVLQGKKVVVLTSRGGSFRPGTPTAQYDHQEPYLRHILALYWIERRHVHPCRKSEARRTGGAFARPPPSSNSSRRLPHANTSAADARTASVIQFGSHHTLSANDKTKLLPFNRFFASHANAVEGEPKCQTSQFNAFPARSQAQVDFHQRERVLLSS
jgi:FMN-dependent NADH-azoreductase